MEESKGQGNFADCRLPCSGGCELWLCNIIFSSYPVSDYMFRAIKKYGCVCNAYSMQYGNHMNLTYEEMDSIVNQGVELGTYVYLFTGGEPLVRKRDIIRLC